MRARSLPGSVSGPRCARSKCANRQRSTSCLARATPARSTSGAARSAFSRVWNAGSATMRRASSHSAKSGTASTAM